ncbi:UDP-N-acetylmuramoyl-L-alanine--D-glutamate ligase [Lachnospiraceae bacterium NSJ-143]|nr:UDP-N-acetylmuramoyl-L-alanine--D-glutamate ligase [Lachnospiraceae bacterium NSJ-143]
MEIRGKKALVCGMAKSGISAAELLNSLGCAVTIQDLKERNELSGIAELENKGIMFYLGKNPDDIIGDFDFVVLSPGIPCDLPFMDKAKKLGVPVISEVELSYRLTPCPVAAITGTNGKTTTTTLAGEMFKMVYKNAAVVGNIGVPYSGEVMRLTENDYVVAEISSFQLETAVDFSPHISAVLNITPDHLNRHKTLENYISMKERVFANQSEHDFCVLNYEDCVTRSMAGKTKARVMFFSSARRLDEGIYIEGNNIFVKWGNIDSRLISVDELKILGVHNYENVMAASGIAICAGIPLDNIVEVLKNFAGVEHRIEFVRTVNGVDYYNDSKGTNTDAAIRGIMAMVKPCVLIGGGYDKGSEYDDWAEKFAGRVKKLVLIGETAQKIAECCDRHGFKEYCFAKSLEEAVNICRNEAVSGECVLLSPACASWDMFKSYEQRGEMFKELVNNF